MLIKQLSKQAVSATFAGALAVFGAGISDAVAQELTIKVANVMGPTHDTSLGIDKFAELVSEKSDGRIEVQHFPGGQLGSDKETYEASQQGLLQFAAGSFANLVTITRAFEVLHLPFIFDNRTEAHAALDSPAVQKLINDEIAKVNMHWLMTLDFGFRSINTTDLAVHSPADLDGLKIRVSRSPTEINAIEAMGGTAVTVDWPEVYNALKFKIVDGEAQPYGTMVSAKHHEIIKHMLEVDFQYYGLVVMTSAEQWDAFPEWAKTIFNEAAAEAQTFHRKIWEAEEARTRQAFLDAGGTISVVSPEDREEWIKLGRSTWEASGVSQEAIDTVRAAATR